MVNVVYLFIGLIIGFLIKHEIDIKYRKKRVERKLKAVANVNLENYNNTLEMIKELNNSLTSLPSYQNTQKNEVR